VASGGRVTRSDGGTWIDEPTTLEASAELADCWIAPNGETWAVGFRMPAAGRWPGLILHRP